MTLRPLVRALAAFALLVTLLGPSVTPAEAHAVLVRSLPASQSGLLASPGSIDLWFSEPLEAEFSRFELLASDGSSLRLDGMRIDPADGQHLSAFPRELAPGIYTVVYRTLSTRDGHGWSGAFTFTVLNVDGTVPTGTAFTPDLGEGNSPQEVVGRWFTFAGLSLVLGGALVLALVWREERAFREAASALYLRLSLAAMPLAIAGSIFQLNAQHEALGGSLRTLLTESRFGTFWLWRAGAVVALTAILLGLSTRRARRHPALLTAPPLLASGTLLTVTMLSHAAAAPGRAWAILVDFAHLELAAVWVGGLMLLASLFVRARRSDPPGGASDDGLLRLVARYSVFAAAALYALGTTGVIRAIGELPTIAAVTGTGYGRWLLVKLALLLPVLLVALFNRRLLARWAEGASGAADAARRLRRMLPLEAALAVVVLFAVAVLGQVPTARGGDVAQTATAVTIPFNRIEQVGKLNLHLQVTPAQVGINELRVHLYRSDGGDPGRIEQVRLNLNATIGAAAGDQLDTESQGDGVFTASAVFASFSRTWAVIVDVRREGFDDTRTQFSVPVQGGAAGGDGSGIFGSPAPQLDINIVWALLLMMGGVGALVSIRRSQTTRGQTIRWGAVGAVFVAGALAVSAQQHLHGVTPQTAPNAGDPTSIARGEPLFTTNCATCHGTDGRGDGPSAAGLVPPPADFVQHIPLHSDPSIFAFISGGLPGTAMPAWSEQLTEQQIWDLVNYLQSEFGEGTRALTSPLPTVVASGTPTPAPSPAATSTATPTTTATPSPSPSPTASPDPASTPATATPTPTAVTPVTPSTGVAGTLLINMSPPSGPPGTPVAVTITGAQPNEALQVATAGGVQFVTADGNGRATASFVAPDSPANSNVLVLDSSFEGWPARFTLTGVFATMSAPAPGLELTSPAITFTWAGASTDALEYALSVGTRPFDNDIYGAGISQGLTDRVRVTSLPTDSSMLYVTIWTRFSSGWQPAQATYTAPPPGSVPPPPPLTITPPTPPGGDPPDILTHDGIHVFAANVCVDLDASLDTAAAGILDAAYAEAEAAGRPSEAVRITLHEECPPIMLAAEDASGS